MAPFVSKVDISRPPADVYSYVTDPTRFPEWQDDVVSVRMEKGEPTQVGTRFVTVRRMGAVERPMTQEVTDVDPDHYWACRAIDGVIRPNATITLEPLDDGARTRATFTLDFEGSGVGVPLVPAARRMAAKGAPRSYSKLKDLLETGR
jgi:uncharacterized protein YndB with AHSA1/START domain